MGKMGQIGIFTDFGKVSSMYPRHSWVLDEGTWEFHPEARRCEAPLCCSPQTCMLSCHLVCLQDLVEDLLKERNMLL